MNFIETEYRKGTIQFCGLQAEFVSDTPLPFEEKSVILGIRPDYVQISEHGSAEGTVFSTLPAGMETTVKINSHGTILTSVVFGSVDYDIDKKVSFDFSGNSIILFDKETEANIAMGHLGISKTQG